MDKENEIFKLLKEIKELLKQLPYNVNLVEEIGADENAHSRILMKFLQYKEEGEYIFLKHFMEQFEIDELVISPYFTADDYTRIDLLVEDKEYFIIIENKINGASDQPKQLERYIKECKKKNRNATIYVIYLTSEGKEPSKGSLSPKSREELISEGGVLLCLSYRGDISMFIKNLISKCRFGENALLSALQQYDDYLDGRYGRRLKDKLINDKMKEEITKLLELDKRSNAEKFKAIRDLNKSLDVLKSRVAEINQDIITSYFQEWKGNIEKRFENRKLEYYDNISYPRVGLRYKYGENEKEKKEFCLIIELNKNDYAEKPYISFWAREQKTHQSIIDLLKKYAASENNKFGYFIEETPKNSWFYHKKRNVVCYFDDALPTFFEVVESFEKFLDDNEIDIDRFMVN